MASVLKFAGLDDAHLGRQGRHDASGLVRGRLAGGQRFHDYRTRVSAGGCVGRSVVNGIGPDNEEYCRWPMRGLSCHSARGLTARSTGRSAVEVRTLGRGSSWAKPAPRDVDCTRVSKLKARTANRASHEHRRSRSPKCVWARSSVMRRHIADPVIANRGSSMPTSAARESSAAR